ncbi:hypothetical protein HDU76_009231, partial [Blyttiomyces sp. JEL0837]
MDTDASKLPVLDPPSIRKRKSRGAPVGVGATGCLLAKAAAVAAAKTPKSRRKTAHPTRVMKAAAAASGMVPDVNVALLNGVSMDMNMYSLMSAAASSYIPPTGMNLAAPPTTTSTLPSPAASSSSATATLTPASSSLTMSSLPVMPPAPAPTPSSASIQQARKRLKLSNNKPVSAATSSKLDAGQPATEHNQYTNVNDGTPLTLFKVSQQGVATEVAKTTDGGAALCIATSGFVQAALAAASGNNSVVANVNCTSALLAGGPMLRWAGMDAKAGCGDVGSGEHGSGSVDGFGGSTGWMRYVEGGSEVAFVCGVEQCGKPFSTMHAIKSHLRCHTVATFACQHCHLSFKRNHDLVRHTRSMHDAGKPHPCPNCDKAFARADALRRHLETRSVHRCPGVPPPPPKNSVAATAGVASAVVG